MTNKDYLSSLTKKMQLRIARLKLEELTPRKCQNRRCVDGIGCYPAPPICLTAYNKWLDSEYSNFDSIWEELNKI